MFFSASPIAASISSLEENLNSSRPRRAASSASTASNRSTSSLKTTGFPSPGAVYAGCQVFFRRAVHCAKYWRTAFAPRSPSLRDANQPAAGFARPPCYENSGDRQCVLMIKDFKGDLIDRAQRAGVFHECIPLHRQAERIINLISNAEDHGIHVDDPESPQASGFGVAIRRDQLRILDFQAAAQAARLGWQTIRVGEARKSNQAVRETGSRAFMPQQEYIPGCLDILTHSLHDGRRALILHPAPARPGWRLRIPSLSYRTSLRQDRRATATTSSTFNVRISQRAISSITLPTPTSATRFPMAYLF